MICRLKVEIKWVFIVIFADKKVPLMATEGKHTEIIAEALIILFIFFCINQAC